MKKQNSLLYFRNTNKTNINFLHLTVNYLLMKTALITGANGGIGKSIVNLFLKNNANVVCLIRKSDKKFEKYIQKLSKNLCSKSALKTHLLVVK